MSGKREAGAGTPAITSRVQTTGYPIIARKPVRFKPLLRPRVYIAGKVAKLDFRHDLVPGLRDWRRENGSLECRDFIYVGPFFNSCDHGCMHGPGSHGVVGGHGYGCLWPEDRGLKTHNRKSGEFYFVTSGEFYSVIDSAAQLCEACTGQGALDFESRLCLGIEGEASWAPLDACTFSERNITASRSMLCSVGRV